MIFMFIIFKKMYNACYDQKGSSRTIYVETFQYEFGRHRDYRVDSP